MKKRLGFTIIELMITIAVIGIGLAIGVPAMNQFVLDNRLVSQINTLNSSLALARSEAVKQNELTVVCVSTTGSSCANNTAWTEGWIVFIDRDGNLTADLGGGDGCAEGATNDCLLAIEPPMSGKNTLVGGPGVPGLIGFNGTGVARCDANKDGTLDPGGCAIANTFFTLCDDRGATHARALAVSNTGRTSSIKTNPTGGALVCP